MVNAELMSYKITGLNMRNDLEGSGQLEIKRSSAFDVTYDIESEMAVATLTESLGTEDDSNSFFIDLTLEGIFHTTGVKSKASKKKVHVKCYDDLFPYAAQIISQLTMNSGMTGVVLEKRTMEFDSVNFGEKPKSDKIIEFKIQK